MISRRRSSSRTDASRGTSGTSATAGSDMICVKSSYTVYKANSLSSTSSSLVGSSLMIWRHSSLPMDPPAPVTSTTLPRIFLSISNGLGGTASRPSKSSISSSRRSLTSTRPWARSIMPGKVRTATWASRVISKMSLRRCRLAEGMANNTTLTFSLPTHFISWSGLQIWRPLSTWPCKRGSSSRNPTTCISRLLAMAPASCRPAEPAP